MLDRMISDLRNEQQQYDDSSDDSSSDSEISAMLDGGDAAIKSATTQYSEFANEAEHDAYSDDDSFDALANASVQSAGIGADRGGFLGLCH